MLRAIYALITYFVVGALINKFYRKASGKDIIPQREFWFLLPFLIKVIKFTIDNYLVINNNIIIGAYRMDLFSPLDLAIV